MTRQFAYVVHERSLNWVDMPHVHEALQDIANATPLLVREYQSRRAHCAGRADRVHQFMLNWVSARQSAMRIGMPASNSAVTRVFPLPNSGPGRYGFVFFTDAEPPASFVVSPVPLPHLEQPEDYLGGDMDGAVLDIKDLHG